MSFLRDLRLAVRSLGRKPGFFAITVLALTLGVGLPTTMYSIVNGVLRELPFEDADRILYIGRSNVQQGYSLRQAAISDYRYWREHQTSFEQLSTYHDNSVSLGGEGIYPEQVRAGNLGPEMLGMLGVTPLLGRGFDLEDASASAQPVAILGHTLWVNRFNRDPAILERQIRIDGQQRSVIGVMPEGFRFPSKEVVWTPLSLDVREEEQGPESSVDVVGRLKEGVTLAQARAEFELFSMQLEAQQPEERKGTRAVLIPYTQERMGDVAPILYTMMAAVSFVLLVACANVANLLLARSVARSREVAIRAALGAGRKRIAAWVLCESMAIAALGGLLGLGIAYLGVFFFNRGIEDLRDGMAFWIDIRVDLPTLAFAAAMVFLGSLAAGAVPAWRTSRADIQQILKQESASASLRMGRFSRVMLAGQITLSCALLAISCLMIKGVIQLKTFEFPFPATRTLSADLNLPRTLYPDIAQRHQFFARLEEEMLARPSVEDAAFASSLPGRGSAGWPVEVEGSPVEREEDLPLTSRVAVSGRFFAALESQILAGRTFSPADDLNSPMVAIVNQGFAQRFFPGQNPLGKQITMGRSPWKQPARTIVGLVPNLYMVNVEYNLPDADGVYVPLTQSSAYQMHMMIRSADPLALIKPLRDAVQRIDPDLPVAQVARLDKALLADKALLEVFGGLFLFFGLAVLFLASLGLYGIVAFSVHQRVREMGIRRALGAGNRHILSQTLRRGAWQVSIGIVLGLAIAALMSPVLAEGFFQTDPHDPVAFLLTALVLCGTGLLACLSPARKALRTSPLEALRYE